MNHSKFVIIVVIFLCVSLSSVSFTSIYAQSDLPLNVSNTEGESYRVQIFAEGNNVFMVWEEDIAGAPDIFFAKSTDDGLSFDKPINLSKNDGDSAFPRLAVYKSNIYVTWYDYSPGESDIFFARSNDGGVSFETVNLSNNSGSSYNPWIATAGNYIYVVWNDGTTQKKTPLVEKGSHDFSFDVGTGNFEIILARSDDGGESFDFINLSNTSGFSWNPRILTYLNNIYIVWNEMSSAKTEIYFTKSEDNGLTFSQPTNVSIGGDESVDAGIEVHKNNVYVVWNEMSSAKTEIYFTKSEDNGNSFIDPIQLSSGHGMTNIVRDKAIVSNENNVYVVWSDNTEGGSDVFFTKSADYGKTFSKAINISQTPGSSQFPQLLAYGKNVYIMWHDYAYGNGDILLRESTDSASTFGSITNLSEDNDESVVFILAPQIAVSDGNVYTVWENKNNGDLFLKSFDAKHATNTLTLHNIERTILTEVVMNPPIPEANKETVIDIRFVDSATMTQLRNVNYSFYIVDSEGKLIVNKTNEHAELGHDTQVLLVNDTGLFTLTIKPEIGSSNTSFDYQSGIVTVIPEFPLNSLFVITLTMCMILLITMSSNKIFKCQSRMR